MAILKREEVLDDWGTLISGANGKAEEVFTATRDLIAETKAPNVAVERREVAPGTIRGLFGTKREFLVVRETGSRRLKPFQMYLNAGDYGTNLAVDWYLMYRSGWLIQVLALLSAIPLIGLLFSLSQQLPPLVREQESEEAVLTLTSLIHKTSGPT